MGMNWAYAMSQGAAHAAGAGADIADRQMKEEAEMRAADRKLSDQERLLAIQDAMKTRAAERFSGVVKNKAGEEIPLEAAPVTELTEGSAKLSGLQDGIQGDKAVVNDILKRAQQTLNNPNATPEQKEDAQGLIDQIGGQVKVQGDINAKAVEGKTRKRSWHEAVDAARQETLMSDAPAFIAGEGMLSAERVEERADKRAAATVKAAEVRAAMEEKKIDSRERIAEQREETRRLEYEKKLDDAAKSGNKQLQQQYAISLRSDITAIDRDIREMNKNKKDKLPDEVAVIDADIAEKKKERTWLVEQQNAFFRESGIKVPDSETDRPGLKSGTSAPRLTYDPTTGKFK